MKLIVNADDFGLSRSVNYGILDSFHLGIVRSTTLMANAPAFEHAIQLAKENKGLGVGIHLVLTSGHALAGPAETLTTNNGLFLKLGAVAENSLALKAEAVKREFTAQVEKVLAAGIVPTHLDSHHHVHMLPGVWDAFAAVASHYQLPIRRASTAQLAEHRLRTTDVFSDAFYGQQIDLASLKAICEPYLNTEQTVEMMSHPAYIDDVLIQKSSYLMQRAEEYRLLTSDAACAFIDENQIELVSFSLLRG